MGGGKPGVPRKRDFEIFKCLKIWHLFFAIFVLRGKPGLPCANSPAFCFYVLIYVIIFTTLWM